MFAGLLSSSVKVEAGTSKTVENEKSYLFAVPEGAFRRQIACTSGIPPQNFG